MARPRVKVSNHAELRFEERLGVTRDMRHDIASRLATLLQVGVAPGPDLDVRVLLPGGYQAVCYPSCMGGWTVATVLPPPDVMIDVELRDPVWPVPIAETERRFAQ